MKTLAPRREVVEPPPLAEELVRPWLLPAVYERLRTGRGEFLTELRPAIPLFVRFSGIDYDDDDEAAGKLDELVRGAQRILSGYGGNLLQLTLGDKGAYLYGVFGSPVAHEDDEARAAAAALELRDLEKSTAAREIQIGITRGRLRSGTYGHAMRRTFVCLGDEVNLSARLMSAAPPGSIYVERARPAGRGRRLHLGAPLGPEGQGQGGAGSPCMRSRDPWSGRRGERSGSSSGSSGAAASWPRCTRGLAEADTGRGRIVGIAAEAGMGKSRLVAEFVRAARRRGHLVAFGECQAFGSNTAYFVFREVWRRLFVLEDGDPEAAQIAQVESRLARIDPALVAAGAAARCGARPADPRHRAHQIV